MVLRLQKAEILNMAFKVYNYHEENKMLKKRGEIKPNSRCWLKPFDKTP
jgi:hypothetical protein